VRIVGGRLGGLALHGPASDAIRPTSDRLRESLFNILEHGYGDPVPGARVMDVFAGTGALGIEAMSRGAATCLFVEESAGARGLIRRNLEAAGLTGQGRIFRRGATHMGPLGPAVPYDLAFLDPPYGRALGERALGSLIAGGWLREGAVVVLEESAKAELALPSGFEEAERRVYGDTQIVIGRIAEGTE